MYNEETDIKENFWGGVCSCAMIFRLSMTAFAADNALQLRDISQNVPAVEGDIELPNHVGDVEVVKEEAPENQDMITNELTFEDAEKPNSGACETWRLAQSAELPRFIKCVRKFTHCSVICIDISCHPT